MRIRLSDRVFTNGTAVRHRDVDGVVGVVRGYWHEAGSVYYIVEWAGEGFAPNINERYVVALPSPLHMLALAAV